MPLIVERLCTHHQVSGFACGALHLDKLLRESTRALATATEVDSFFVAHHGDHVVIGFMAIGDSSITVDDGVVQTALVMSALAVDLSVQNSAVVRALLKRAFAVRDGRLRFRPYDYEAAVVIDNERVESMIERMGFQRVGAQFWIRRLDRS
jgi:hypothetical protein